MKPSDDLFLLIRSLEKSEKRYFRLQNPEGNNERKYHKLFDAIDHQKEYNESALKKKFRGEKFVKQLTFTKNYLYRLIMTSLRNYSAGRSVDNQLKTTLLDIEILYDKRLFNQCDKLISRAKAMASKFERHPDMLELKRWEAKLMRGVPSRISSGKFLNDFYADSEKTLNSYRNYLDYENLFQQFFYNYFRKGLVRADSEANEYRKLIAHPLLAGTGNSSSYFEKYFFHTCWGIYYLVHQEKEECYAQAKKVVDLMEESFHQVEQAQNYYVSALNNLIVCQFITKRFKETPATILKLRAIKTRSRKTGTELFFTIINNQMNYYAYTFQYDEAAKFIEKMLPRILTEDKNAEYRQHSRLVFFNAAGMFLINGDLRSARTFIGRIINRKSEEFLGDIYCVAKIMNLIINYELQDTGMLKHVGRSAYRHLYKTKRLYKFETLMLDFILKKIPKANSEKMIINLFEELKKEVDLLRTDPFEGKIFVYFDFLSWIECKIKQRPFSEIVRERAQDDRINS